uniref:von Willebrand factor A domain containing 7 n=1 Tax=Sphenodon punctatus TaxID=8508 RepID=A0A8D0H0L2_SPHPU
GPPHSAPAATSGPSAMGTLLWTLGVLVLPPQRAVGFLPNFWSRAMAFAWGSVTHQDMTEDAILNVTLRLFRVFFPPLLEFRQRLQTLLDLFALKGLDGFPGRSCNPSDQEHGGDLSCWGSGGWSLTVPLPCPPRPHLISPSFLLPVQDFYSHSNWVELGRREIHPRLLQPGREIKSLAEADVPTCTDCTHQTCRGNILDGVQAKGLLTTGYYGSNPDKPPGKCSHGGRFDSSQSREPRGGINKDSNSLFFSPHHYLHGEAAALGLEASVHFLDKLHRELGRKQFMRLLDISPAMGLSFVIDTTGSMGEEIKAARRQAWEIIQQRRGTAQEPDQYLLVPFHDPDFGPAYKTSNSEEFLQHLNSISPLAGGDEPEMCLSALQLALLNSPPLSEIFVFTDASAKDRHLKNSVKALIEERRCKVTFLITEDPSRTRVRREILAPDRFDLYVSLALHSGGQVIFTDNNNIWSAAEVIGESAATSVRGGKRSSAFDFLYYFAVPFEGPHPGLFKLDSRPVEGRSDMECGWVGGGGRVGRGHLLPTASASLLPPRGSCISVSDEGSLCKQLPPPQRQLHFGTKRGVPVQTAAPTPEAVASQPWARDSCINSRPHSRGSCISTPSVGSQRPVF